MCGVTSYGSVFLTGFGLANAVLATHKLPTVKAANKSMLAAGAAAALGRRLSAFRQFTTVCSCDDLLRSAALTGSLELQVRRAGSNAMPHRRCSGCKQACMLRILGHNCTAERVTDSNAGYCGSDNSPCCPCMDVVGILNTYGVFTEVNFRISESLVCNDTHYDKGTSITGPESRPIHLIGSLGIPYLSVQRTNLSTVYKSVFSPITPHTPPIFYTARCRLSTMAAITKSFLGSSLRAAVPTQGQVLFLIHFSCWPYCESCLVWL